ncbi:MAG: signal peptide peptidase SppA [Rickettsiales bacterium]|nr:signal peptide peptidase SppA [Rickettsiales bacterium]
MNSDQIIERNKLKKQISTWRILAFVTLLIAIFLVFGDSKNISQVSRAGAYIARVKIDGVIFENSSRDEILNEIAEDKNVKAVILSVNSPGGTAVGGETLYKSIKKLNDKKPVVTIMNSVAASAGYLVTLGSERIFAHQGTITGSIGVIMEIPNVKEASDKLGVKFNYIRTSPLKASPSLFEEVNPEALKVYKDMMQDFFVYFKNVIVEERKLPASEVEKLADGRIFSGFSAKQKGLVDEIGGEDEAIEWLVKNKKISSKIEVEDVKLYRPEDKFEEFLEGAKSFLSIDGFLNSFGKKFSLFL